MSRPCDELADSFESGKEDVIVRSNTYTESVCRTILSERGIELGSSVDHQALLSETFDKIGLKTHPFNGEVNKIVQGHSKISDAINSIRNRGDLVSHGKISGFESTYKNHRRIVVLGADAVLGLLLDADEGVEPNLRHTLRPYEHFPVSNMTVDRTGIKSVRVSDGVDGISEIEIETANGPYRFRLSEILWNLDRPTYIDLLNQAGPELTGDVDAPDETGEPE